MLALPSFSCLSIFLTTHLHICFYVAGGHDPLKAALNAFGKFGACQLLMYCFSTSNPHFFVLLCAFGAGLNKQHLVFARGSVFARLCQHGEQREAVGLEEEGGGALSGVLISKGW